MSNLAFSNIHKAFGKRRILEGAELVLHAGQCVLLTGPNGAGKSTLQRICAGLEKPETTLVDAGHGAHTWKQQRQYLQEHCVYLHQQPYMFDGSVIQNLDYALPRKLAKATRLENIEMALHWAGLENIAECWAKSLSGGERQRVSLARAWLRSPRFLLLDEPTNNLDEATKYRTVALLMSLKAQNISLLIASHETEQFNGIAEYRYELSQGKLFSRAPTAAITSNVIPLIKPHQVAL